MAIDFDEVFETLDEMSRKLDDVLQIVHLAKAGKVVVDQVGEFNFTTAQKTALKSKYDSLKAEIATLWQSLP